MTETLDDYRYILELWFGLQKSR